MSSVFQKLSCVVSLVFMVFNAESAPRVTVTFPSGMSADALDGRLILIFAPGGEQEPRLQVSWDQDAIPFFAMDVARWKPGKKQTFDGRSAGFPVPTIDELPAGDYRVQAVVYWKPTGERLRPRPGPATRGDVVVLGEPETAWREALTGSAAAARVRAMLQGARSAEAA